MQSYEQGSSNMTGTSPVYELPKTASDVPRISREMGAIQKLLAEHTETANVFEQRLHAVLRGAGPEAANGGQADPRAATSPLAADLEAFVGQLSRLLAHYNDILSRLEV